MPLSYERLDPEKQLVIIEDQLTTLEERHFRASLPGASTPDNVEQIATQINHLRTRRNAAREAAENFRAENQKVKDPRP